jgi:hypothetical protein
MDSGLFGEGSISLDWLGVEGFPGLQPQLLILGKLIAKGYGIGAVVELTADITAWEIAGTYAFIGSATPQPFVLNWVKNLPMRPNPRPPDETIWDVRMSLPLSPSIIEGLEERRQGKSFSLQVITKILLIDGGEPKGPRTQAYYATHPTRTSEDRLQVSQDDWGKVLESWQRGVGIPILLPLTSTEPNPELAEVVRHLREARQFVDGGDYSGSCASSRKALELLRKLSPAVTPIPTMVNERDVNQRIRRVIDALFEFASTPAHVDGAGKDYKPTRSDAVALAGATASVAQQVFAQIN